jgi:vacuolar protein sorting-associated protein 54
VALQQKLTVILYVSQALAALKLLVAAADCAGALDVIDDLQNLLDTDELAGLYCFRHIRDQLGTSLDSVNSRICARCCSRWKSCRCYDFIKCEKKSFQPIEWDRT